MKNLVLLRAHAFDEHVSTAYATLKRFSLSNDTCLLLDVSRGDITTNVPTIRFSGERLMKIGLPMHPEGRWAWHAGDYALYSVFLDAPEYDFYVMIDYDVRVNFSIDDLLERVSQSSYDFVAPYAGFEKADWMWTAAGRHWFPRVLGSFFPLVVLSRRLIARCLERRLVHSRAVPIKEGERRRFLWQNWMNCEAFVPSLAFDCGFGIVDINKIVPGWTYEFFRAVDVLYWDMPEIANIPAAHPVFLRADLPRMIQKRLLDLPEGDLKAGFIRRARALKFVDEALWVSIAAANPGLLE